MSLQEQLADIRHAIGRVEGRVEAVQEGMKRVEKLDERVDKVESSVSYIKGQSSIISFIISAAVTFGSKWLGPGS